MRNMIQACALGLVTSFVNCQAQECMKVTEEIGAVDRVRGVDFVSNMNDLAVKLEEKVLYMRT